LIQIKTQTVGLAHPMPIVASIGQHPCFEHRSTLHFFISVRERAVVEIKITGLFDQALQFNRVSSIRIGLAHIGERLLDNLAVLACPFGFRLLLDHSLFKEWDNQGELLLALRLPTKHPSRLLCLAAPLAMPMDNWRGDPLLHLFVGIAVGACGKLVKPIPQGADCEINDLAGNIQQAQRICLDLVGQAQRIT